MTFCFVVAVPHAGGLSESWCRKGQIQALVHRQWGRAAKLKAQAGSREAKAAAESGSALMCTSLTQN